MDIIIIGFDLYVQINQFGSLTPKPLLIVSIIRNS